MFKKTKILICLMILAAAIFTVANFALAQGLDVGMQYGEQIGLGGDDPRVMAANVIRIALGFLGIIAVGLIIYAGWLYMTAAGEEEKIEKAKKILTGAIIGLVIVLSAFAIASFILNKLLTATTPGAGPGAGTGVTPGAGPGAGTGTGNDGGAISCDSLAGPDICEADATLCPENYYCETGSCTCQAGGGFGESCDSDGGTATCEADNNLCSAYLICDTGTCICLGAPVIDWVSPVDGAIGNLTTIGGRYFGDTAGRVYFWDGGGYTIEAEFPGAPCDENWQNNQIIVIVPAGAVSGPIKVVTSDAREDTTDNDRGPNLDDFVINTTVRPGLCKIDPAAGTKDNRITYYGLGLSGGSAFYGSEADRVAAQNSVFSADNQGTAGVPDIKVGQTTSFVLNNGLTSNYLKFTKNREPYAGPKITFFEPTQGAPGQYVTIHGSGFGTIRGSNGVYFFETTRKDADFNFPPVCADSLWRDNQVIVKVPVGLADGNYDLNVEIGAQTAVSSTKFEVKNSLALSPSLCKIKPSRGPSNTPISLWGENFGDKDDVKSKVRFNSNKEQSGAAITFWGDEDGAQKIETTVHQEAITGPVQVVQDTLVGNGLNFTVGSCANNNDCAENVDDKFCCPAGSSEEGKCKANIDGCYITVASSVYEWDFSTGAGETVPPSSYFSCLGKSKATGKCDSGGTCPNSPGKCSPYGGGGGQIVGEGCGDDYCNNRVCTGECTYNSTLNKCVTAGDCDLNNPSLTKDALNKEITAYCAEYNGSGHWQIDTELSCPSGWTKIPGDKCVNTTLSCSLCGSGFVCLDDNDNDLKGLCAINQEICPRGSVCETDKCILKDKASCECCCEIGQDARDCCAPLVCKGTCGNDTSDDGSGFGRCSGCADVGTTQSAHDAACNCGGTSGKICDTSVAGGICRDCEQLPSKEECSKHTTCCVDAMNKYICRGGTGDKNMVKYDDSKDDLAYCQYYQCKAGGDACDSDNNPVASSTRSVYETSKDCGEKCSQVSRPGKRCVASTMPELVCNASFSCGTDYSCRTAADDECGTCCCNPGTPEVNANGLICAPNKSPCTGATRGLYCGCEEDQDCGSKESVGCSSDTCCRAKPRVSSVYPAGDAAGVCLNTLISANFNEKMDIASFSGNVVVVGDYENSVCPAGTQYLALNNGPVVRKNLAVSFYRKVLSVLAKVARPLFGGKVLAGTTDPSHNYCALTGMVNGVNKADGTTDLTFSLNKPLEKKRKYYVVIKGDENLDSSKGVLSSLEIGLNENDTETFGGKTFTKAKIWSFTTGNDICQLSSVSIYPPRYLFKTAGAVSAQSFEAKPLSASGQTISPVTGYNWGWNWGSDNSQIAEVTNSGSPVSSVQTVTAQNVKDGKTLIKATATITEDTVSGASTVGQTKTGRAEVYVFLCANPWPPIKADSTWEPWRDKSTNCTIDDHNCGAGSDSCCYNTNYELYYCRDRGAAGSADDLPAILSEDTIVRGESKIQDILKEAYFFREGTPSMASDALLSGEALPQGKAVSLVWHPLGQCDNGESCGVGLPCSDESTCIKDTGVSGYKVYYGPNINNLNGKYSPLDVGDKTSVELGQGTAYNISDDLNNGNNYYFAITAYYGEGADNVESALSNVIEIKIEDKEGPAIPTMTLTPGDRKVTISWTSDPEATSFRVYYKATDTCNDSVNFGDSQAANKSPVTISGLTNGTKYCFGVAAYDAENNESEKAAKSAIPVATPTNIYATAGDMQVDLIWHAAVGAVSYKVYKREAAGTYDVSIAEGLTDAKYTTNGLTNGTTYYFVIKSVNADGLEGTYSQEEEATPFAAPADLSATAGNGLVILTWKKADGAVSYKIYQGTDSGSYNESYPESNITNGHVTGLVNGTTYYFAVKSININGQGSAYSNEVSARPVATP
ncbi:MAG: IPT/TIG domain-containing protein [Patescibacteria group bacterium]|nr:IPT/TIG domain-containing protein [Patescibacteria group bacterium]MDD5554481.1 IPT/TIG domain-containing protein [Patescibacteria group bacterium]